MKNKQKRKHLSTAKPNLREDALRHRHRTVDLTQDWKAWEAASSDDLTTFSCKDKLSCAELGNTQECMLPAESYVEAPASGQTAQENSSSSEYFSCVSSPTNFPYPDDNELGNTQEYVPQVESCAGAPASHRRAQENTSSSEYLSCASSPSKLPQPDEDGIPEMPEYEDLDHSEMSPLCSHTFSPFYLLNDNLLMPPVHGTNESVMTIYYTRVQMKRSVAVLGDTEEGLEPPSKHIKMEEMTYTEMVDKNVPLSPMSEKKPLTDHEPVLDSRAHEKGEKPDNPAEPPTREESPEWLAALYSGFRCLACCRVFSSLEALREHVEYGVRQGFSCHAFHLALARLKHKNPQKEEEQENQGGNI